MQLVENVRQAWRWFSVQVLTVLTALPLVWMALPPESQDLVPESWRPWALAVVALCGLLGRLVKQKERT